MTQKIFNITIDTRVRNIELYSITEVLKLIQLELLEYLLSATKVDFNEKNEYGKRLFLHFFIKGVCDLYSRSDSAAVIVLSRKDYVEDVKLWRILDRTEYLDFIESKIRELQKALPVPLVSIKTVEDNPAELAEVAQDAIDRVTQRPRTIKHMKSFAKKHGLTYIQTKYIQSPSFQKLLYKTISN